MNTVNLDHRLNNRLNTSLNSRSHSTSIPPFAVLRSARLITTCMLVSACVLVGACGNSGKKITTRDDSADYRNAVVLPPLKKPSRVLRKDDTNELTYVAPSEELIQEQGQIPAQTSVIQTAPLRPAPLAASNEKTISSSATRYATSASIVRPSEGVARLSINQGFDQAWEYLAQQLQSSGITVFSRNETAGRISIGCASVDDAGTVVRKGRWSFMRKNKTEQLEHCALQAVSAKDSTVVSVLNRSGQEISGDKSAQVFQRMLAN